VLQLANQSRWSVPPNRMASSPKGPMLVPPKPAAVTQALDPDAEARYRAVAADASLGEFWNKAKPTRAPYSAGEVMCRGAMFYPKFAEVR